ncbi:hypothetical protein M1N64_02350, partial [Peptococcaceae bacterium]|nr:hypothetical protein [Peptococcaceae bacterium]
RPVGRGGPDIYHRGWTTWEIAPPPDIRDNYQNIRAEVKVGVTAADFTAAQRTTGASGVKYVADWEMFKERYNKWAAADYRITSYRMGGNYSVRIDWKTKLKPMSSAKCIRKSWQSPNVEGWKWMMPFTIEWYGVPKGAVGLTVSNLRPVGEPRNGEQRWNMEVHNMGVKQVDDILIRAYVGSGGVLRGNLGMIGDYQNFNISYTNTHQTWLHPGQRIRVSFETAAPPEGYDVIATANLRLGRTGFFSSEIRGIPELAVTPSGLKYENVVQIRPHTGVNIDNSRAGQPGSYYQDNIMVASGLGWTPPNLDPPEQGNQHLDNLAVTRVEILDRDTGNPVTTPSQGQRLIIRATFDSSFSVEGHVRLRLYEQRRGHDPKTEGFTSAFMAANGTIIREWHKTARSGETEYIASINFVHIAGNWQHAVPDSVFETETTLDDNKLGSKATGQRGGGFETSGPWFQGAAGWYPPEKWIPGTPPKPIYETVTKEVRLWREVDFIPADEEPPGIGVRLIE